MELKVFVDDDGFAIDVPDFVLNEGEEFFARMDSDMENGVQMSRQWVERPTLEQRCQVAAEKLLNAVHRSDQPTAMMMAGYILARCPNIEALKIPDSGDITEIRLIMPGQTE